jgi:hypothetical protein
MTIPLLPQDALLAIMADLYYLRTDLGDEVGADEALDAYIDIEGVLP